VRWRAWTRSALKSIPQTAPIPANTNPKQMARRHSVLKSIPQTVTIPANMDPKQMVHCPSVLKPIAQTATILAHTKQMACPLHTLCWSTASTSW